jgi:hypothetical protein
MALAPQPPGASLSRIRHALAAIVGCNWTALNFRPTLSGMLVKASRFPRQVFENRQLLCGIVDVRSEFEIVGSNVVIPIYMGHVALAVCG